MSELEATPEKNPVGRPPNKKTVEASPELVEMLMEKFQAMMQQNADNTLVLAETLRKPTELEQAKLDKEKEQLQKRAKMSIEAARQKEVADQRKISACRAEGHKDKNGDTRFRAQINSNGYYVPLCQKCQIQTRPIKAAPGQTAVGMHEWKGVTEETLNNMAAISEGAA